MEKYNFISGNELFVAVENDPTENNFKTAAEFLMGAITDWPTLNLRDPGDFIAELRKEINVALVFENLERYSKSLYPAHDAWKIESVSALMELFDFERKKEFDRTVELETIVSGITQHYRVK